MPCGCLILNITVDVCVCVCVCLPRTIKAKHIAHSGQMKLPEEASATTTKCCSAASSSIYDTKYKLPLQFHAFPASFKLASRFSSLLVFVVFRHLLQQNANNFELSFLVYPVVEWKQQVVQYRKYNIFFCTLLNVQHISISSSRN